VQARFGPRSVQARFGSRIIGVIYVNIKIEKPIVLQENILVS